MPDLILFEENKAYVIDRFHEGHFDYIEAVQEVVQRDFFRFITSKGILDKLQATYPYPRSKQEVPAWFYIAADMAMRLHGNHAFYGFPWVVATGGLLTAFGPQLGTRHVNPETGELRIECKGFNNKNRGPRRTPCDQDTLRKIAGDTRPEDLLAWFNGDVQHIFRKHRFFDKSGIFIGDGSYLFVPDNENYEGSVRMLFDEGNHPVSTEKHKQMTPEQASRCQWRRCYKLVSLLHMPVGKEYFLYAGLAVLPGNAHEGPVLWKLVDDFVATMGKGVIKHLILDRGFIDGVEIAHAKTHHGIDTTIGVRSNMSVYKDALGLASLPETVWQCYDRPTPVIEKPTRCIPYDERHAAIIRKREATRQATLARRRAEQGKTQLLTSKKQQSEKSQKPQQQWITRVSGTTSFDNCSVPLDVVLCSLDKDPNAQSSWAIMTTDTSGDAKTVVERYALRTAIEERHRHIKCFWDITDFKSTNFALIANQVVFTLLTFSLLQQHLFRNKLPALNNASKSRMQERLAPASEYIMVFTDGYYARFDTYEYTRMVMDVPEKSRAKLSARLALRQQERRWRSGKSPPA